MTSFYLSNADELQIKLAQGAKPGEGGELPGHKVSESIAKTRKSIAGVGLISPPPHHDIYSIEDLKQLIYDLKCSNPIARISVKLVSEVGIGVIASGVAKAKAEHILVSGHDGGTGAARWTGIKHAGLPWELGLAETHQTLVLNKLRDNVVLQTDGQIKTGRDVAIACLLGAEEWGFATTPLIALGCIMMRKCHLNTCPVGIATQDPVLRKKFEGSPENVINFFYFVAEEMRGIMAKLGFRSVREMVGRSDLLRFSGNDVTDHHHKGGEIGLEEEGEGGVKGSQVVHQYLHNNPKMKNIDFSLLLKRIQFDLNPVKTKQDFSLEKRLENQFVERVKESIEKGEKLNLSTSISNSDRSFGTTTSYLVSKRMGEKGLSEDSVVFKVNGSAGQSFGAFLTNGIRLELEGDANDGVGKGLSGGNVIIYPPKDSPFKAEENIIVGNVCFYGATSGRAYISGIASERFCVRNSGAEVIVEGVGDHGCEYMTGGKVIILGSTGRNFGAGMSGGIAYVYDPNGSFPKMVNREMVGLEGLEGEENIKFVKEMLEKHFEFTGSSIAKTILSSLEDSLKRFVVVMPTDYKNVLQKQAKEKLEQERLTEQEKQKKKEEEEKKEKDAAKKQIEEKIVDLEDIVTNEKEASKQLDKIRGFLKYKHKHDDYREVKTRTKDWKELSVRQSDSQVREQTARCMDCGIPFCQSDYGCPVANIIPSFNELVFQNKWREAYDKLALTNNFPEFTGRVCPAPCEGACVLGIIEKPVAIKSIECAIIDKAFEMGWVSASVQQNYNGKKVAVIGSGPAGLAAADMLNRVGYKVSVYEKSDRFGGLLMYGIPNAKLDKRVVQRRIDLLEKEGIKFICNANVGVNVDASRLREENDAVLIATGANWPRDLQIPNRHAKGIYFAMDYLHSNTKSLLDSQLSDEQFINAKDKHVIVIGGGDTGNDCIGTAVRHGAASVINFDYHEPSPEERDVVTNAWPQYPRIFRVEYGHAEVKHHFSRDPREFCTLSKRFECDEQGNLTGISTAKVEWIKNEVGKWQMREVEGSLQFWKADIILLSMGYAGPEVQLLEQFGVKDIPAARVDPSLPPKNTPIKYSTNVEKVFAAGDSRRGQSLVVWAIKEGREAAREMDKVIMGRSTIPKTGGARSIVQLPHKKVIV